MGTHGAHHDSISRALFGDVRRSVLETVFRADRPLYVREIIRESGVGQGAVQRELTRLHGAGLLVREERGNSVYYAPDPDAPVYGELRSLVAKTSGFAGVLADRLQRLGDSIEAAFIYGSVASGEAGPASDVDVFLIGEPDELALHSAMSEAEKELGRTVNYSVMSRDELGRRRKEPGGFVARVLAGPTIAVIGDAPDDD
jgi:predicted nucleotidyltransferase